MRVEVFSGSVELATSAKTVKLGKDKVLEFDPEATEVALNAEAGNRQGFLGQVDVRARYPIATFALGPSRPGARPALWLERLERLRRMGILPRFRLWLVAFRVGGLVALQHGDVELVPGHGLHVDFRRALGLAALSLRQLGFLPRLRLVLDAGQLGKLVPGVGQLVFGAGMDWLGATGREWARRDRVL